MMGDVALSSYKQQVGDARGGSDSRILVVSVASAEANGHDTLPFGWLGIQEWAKTH